MITPNTKLGLSEYDSPRSEFYRLGLLYWSAKYDFSSPGGWASKQNIMLFWQVREGRQHISSFFQIPKLKSARICYILINWLKEWWWPRISIAPNEFINTAKTNISDSRKSKSGVNIFLSNCICLSPRHENIFQESNCLENHQRAFLDWST